MLTAKELAATSNIDASEAGRNSAVVGTKSDRFL